ncbi:ECF transporter S component [Falseniella ignava]|uniref:ECF transporter S component n=2 Tax=Falseniella ignava TaxID=137730 RepID=K1M0A0_9LACT|nr:ECF transporter S component [Falseniella ignava]EKB55733.1 hypothetical protein HMPREF9707_00920 [Falseniella ignava CCUG 37419]PKY87328.1 ECF transporter S component [Falseniella ignava]
MKEKNMTYYLIISAVLAALTVIMTMIVQVPLGAGYFNLGDAVLMIGGLLLGPQWGFLIGGIGSALADIFAGWANYALFTFFVKGLEGFLAGYLFHRFHNRLAAVIPAGLVMALGYFIVDSILYDVAAATASIGGNLLQGLIGAGVAFLLYPLVQRALASSRAKL